jgi:hypothetical protein
MAMQFWRSCIHKVQYRTQQHVASSSTNIPAVPQSGLGQSINGITSVKARSRGGHQ